MMSENLIELMKMGYFSADEQHLEIYDLICELCELIENRSTRNEVLIVCNNLHNSLVDHFSLEESIMERRSYPDSNSHNLEHAVILKEFNRVKGSLMDYRINRSNEVSDQEIKKGLMDMIVEHTLSSDKELGRFIRNIIEEDNVFKGKYDNL